MKKSWLELYGLAVCLFSIIMIVVFSGILFWNVVQITAPSFSLDSDTWSHYQSDESFRETMVNRYCCNNVNCSYDPPKGAALTEAREAAFAQTLVAEQRSGIQSLLQNAIVMLIALVVFLGHWRIAKKARLQNGA